MLPIIEEMYKKAEHYDELAAKAAHNYQMTGLLQYSRNRKNYEDLADVYRKAAAASDDHHSLLALRSEMISFADKFDKVITSENFEPMDLLPVSLELINYAVIMLRYKRIETPKVRCATEEGGY